MDNSTVIYGVLSALIVVGGVLWGFLYRRFLRERAAGEAWRLKAEVADERVRQTEERMKSESENCRRLLAEKERTCEKMVDSAVATLREQFTTLAVQKLKASTEGLADVNQKNLAELMKPLQTEIDRFRQAFDANREQQVKNKASFDQAIADLGRQAFKIGADADNLARALKRESKTQGNWGEMVLANILAAAGLKDGIDFVQQPQEVDADGNRLIPDVEIPLPNGEKLLIDSKASITAYLDYVAAADEAAKNAAVQAHVVSMRRHLEELAAKDYIKKVKGSQGYILMFIPNEGSYLLAVEHDAKLVTDAFARHVILVNPTTLLLCIQIVALLRSRERQNENAEKVFEAARRMYDKFVGFTETFADMGRRLDGLAGAYRKANGQLCDGKGNLVRQVEGLRDMGLVPKKTLDAKLLEAAEADVQDVT